MLYRHRDLSNNFNVTSPPSWRIRSKYIQKFKQNAMRNMHYSQFLIHYYVYTDIARETFESIFLKKIRNEAKINAF